MNSTTSKIILSIVSIAIILLRRLFPQFQIDAIDLALIVIMFLPWFSGLIKGMELPGGFKIEFQDLKEAGDKIIKQISDKSLKIVKAKEEVFITKDNNSNLALVSLRIEIEKRIQKLIEFYKIDSRSDIPSLLYKLKQNCVLNDGLRTIVMFGNRAAHGVRVDQSVVEWAQNVGPKILSILDSKIEKSN
jgi:hypothetical protein